MVTPQPRAVKLRPTGLRCLVLLILKLRTFTRLYSVLPFLHSTYIDHGNKLQNPFPVTADPPKATVTMWPPRPPSSAFRWLTYEIKEKRKKRESIIPRPLIFRPLIFHPFFLRHLCKVFLAFSLLPLRGLAAWFLVRYGATPAVRPTSVVARKSRIALLNLSRRRRAPRSTGLCPGRFLLWPPPVHPPPPVAQVLVV